MPARVGAGGLGRDADLGQRRGDRVGEQLRVEERRRRDELVADTIEPPQRVEVHHAAALKLGDLHVGRPHS
jgi:hypothetical protein